MNNTGRGRGYSRGGAGSNSGWTVVPPAGRARPPGQAGGRGRPVFIPPPAPQQPQRPAPQQPQSRPETPWQQPQSRPETPRQQPQQPQQGSPAFAQQPDNSQRSYEIVHHDDRYNPNVDAAKTQDPFYDHHAVGQNTQKGVEISGQHAMAASIFVAAAQALGWSRDRLRIAMEDHSFTLASTPDDDQEHQNALQQIQYALLHLTYIRTHWTSYAAAFLRIWPSVRGYKYGIKEKIKYLPGHHLLTFGVHWEGQHYDWKLDLDTQAAIRNGPPGTNTFQATWEPMQSNEHARLLLGVVETRVREYYRHLHTTFHRDNTKRQKLQDLDSYTRRGTCSEFTMSLALQAAEALKAISSDTGNDFDHVDTSGVPLRASLGNVFWYEVAPEPYPPDADADVTFNPERKKQFAKTIQPPGKPRISVRVCKHYPARRQWGVHVHTENEKTIQFLNQMMPSIGMGWYEIFLTVGTTEFHFKLTPWQQPKTTFVQPFILAHDESPLLTGNYPKKTVEHEGTQAEIPDPERLQLPDFRTLPAQEFTVKALDPYLITGRGSEIDGMVHSLLAVEPDKVGALSAACLLMPREIMAMATGEQDDGAEPDGPTRAANRVLQYMRAYYSTDNPTRPGNLNPFGEYSIFFFSCLNYVVGVQMYSPTIHYLNQRGGDDLHELPPRAAQTQAVVHVQEERGRARSRSTSRPARGEAARYEVDRVPQQVLDRLEQTERSMRELMEALRRGGPQGGELRNLEERLVKMIEDTRHSADGVNASSASHVVQRAAYAEADTQIKKTDLTGGWRASFQDSEQDKAPNKLTMYGHPDFFSNDKLAAVQKQEAVTLTLDEKQASTEGVLVYKHENGHLTTYLYITLRYEEGYREPFYVWAIQFIDSGVNASELQDQDIDMANFCLIKKQWRSVLALTASTKQNTFTWRATSDLKTWKDLGQYNWIITVEKTNDCEWITRGNKNNWTAVDVYFKYTIKPDGTLQRQKQIINSPVAALSKVQGLGGDQYNVQLYGSYSGAPENDRTGVLNKYIGLKIYKLHYKLGNTEIKYENEDIIQFELVDSELPEYVGEFYDRHHGDTYTLTLTPYYSNTKLGGAYTWGLKSNVGLSGWDGSFIAHIPDEASEPALMNRFNEGNLFRFQYGFEGNKINVTAQDLLIRGMPGPMIQRIPNYTTLRDSTEDSRNERIKGIFKPQGSRELAKLMPPNRNDLIKHVESTAAAHGRMCKYCLFVYHKDFSSWMNQNQIRGKTVRFDHNNIPMVLKLEHPWLNGQMATERNIVYPENDYTLWLVDAQGPVWVSVNGNYMICPYGDDNKRLKTWGLYRWDEKGLTYDIMAIKEKKSGTHLISHDQFERARSLSTTNTWRFYKLWTGSQVTSDHAHSQKFNEMKVVIVVQDTNKTVPPAPGGKAQLENPYRLQVRMPDYTVPVAMDKLVQYAARNAKKIKSRSETGLDGEDKPDKMATSLTMTGEEALEQGDEQHEAGEGEEAPQQGNEQNETAEGEEALQQGDEQAQNSSGKNSKRQTIKQRQKETKENVEQILNDLETHEKPSSKYTEQERIIFKNTRIGCLSLAQKIIHVTEVFCTETMTDDWWDHKYATQDNVSDKEWMSAINRELKDKLKSHFVDNPDIETVLDFYRDPNKVNVDIINHFVKEKEKEMIAQVLAVVIERKQKAYLKRKEKARNAAERQAKKNEMERKKIEKTILPKQEQNNSEIVANDTGEDPDYDPIFYDDITEFKKRKEEEQAKKHKEDFAKQHEDELKRGKPVKNPDESEKEYGQRLREWQETDRANQDAEKAKEMQFARQGDDVTADPEEYTQQVPAEFHADNDDDQDELENDVELVRLLIRAPTPWYDRMEMVRYVLTKMTDYKNQAIKQQRDRNSQLQRIQEDQKKRYEEEVQAKQTHIQEHKSKLIAEKSSQQDVFKKKFDGEHLRPTDPRMQILSSCRVYNNSHSTLPTNLKVQFPSILITFMKSVQTLEFTLVDPFTLTYIAVHNDVVLGFQPREFENDQGETHLAWKFLLFKSNTKVGVEDPAITLGVKWTHPQTLLTDSKGMKDSTEPNSGEWRFRFRSIPGSKMLKSDKFKFDVLNLDQYKDSIKFVYYYPIDFTATFLEKESKVLPEYTIQAAIPEHDDAVQHIYSDAMSDAVLGGNYHRSVWPSMQLSSNPLRFFEMPSSLFMQFSLSDQKSTAFFKLQGYDIAGDFTLDTNKEKIYKFKDDVDPVEWVAQLATSTFILREASVDEAVAPAAQEDQGQAASGEEKSETAAGEAPAETSAVGEETGAALSESQKNGWEIWYSFTPSNASTPVEFKLLEHESRVLLDNSGEWRVAAAPGERLTKKFKDALTKLGINSETPGTVADLRFSTKTDVEGLQKYHQQYHQQLVVKWAAKHWFTAGHTITYVSTDVGEGGRQHAEQTLALAAELGLDLAFCSHPFTCISVPAAAYRLCGAAGPARATLLPLQPRKQAARARKLELPPVLSAAPQARCRPPLLSFRR